MPTTAVIPLCEDKLALIVQLTQLGFGEPMPADGSIFRMSCRSEFSAFGEGTVIIANRTEENQFRSPVDAETHFTQEHIDGQLKYATDVNIAKGRIVFSRSYMYFFPPGT